MRTIVFIIVIWSTAAIQSVHAQNAESDNDEIMYDPTFWKEDLRLSKEQYFAINEINSEFYNNLILAVQQVAPSKEPTPSALLSQRKDLIWGLLSPRQKSKWKKISKSFN